MKGQRREPGTLRRASLRIREGQREDHPVKQRIKGKGRCLKGIHHLRPLKLPPQPVVPNPRSLSHRSRSPHPLHHLLRHLLRSLKPRCPCIPTIIPRLLRILAILLTHRQHPLLAATALLLTCTFPVTGTQQLAFITGEGDIPLRTLGKS